MIHRAALVVCLVSLAMAAGISESQESATTDAAPVTMAAISWPWAFDATRLELLMIRLRFDAGETTARAYLGVPKAAGNALTVEVSLTSPDSRTAWTWTGPVAAGVNYALDFRLPGAVGSYALKAALRRANVAGPSSSVVFEKRLHPATLKRAQRDSVDLLFSETEERRRTAGPWPVAVGVPFGRGSLTSDSQIRVVDPEGKEVPVQVETLYRWYANAPDIKWALLRFQPTLTPGGKPYRVEFGAQVRRSTDVPASSALADRAKNLAERWIKQEAYLVRNDGTVYWGANDTEQSRVEIEESGPLVATAKITGRYVSDQGQPLCRYESRLSVFRGCPAVRIYFTIDWNQNDDVVASDVGIEIPTGFTGSAYATEGLPNQELPANGSIVMLQDEWNHYRLAGKVGEQSITLKEGEDAPGYLVLKDDGKQAAVFMRDMNRNLPTEIEVTPDALVLHMWAGDVKPLSWKAADVVTPAMRDYYGDKLTEDYTKGGPLNTLEGSGTSPFGAAKTLEFWVLPPDANGDPAAINALVQEPVVMLSDPKRTEQTDVWGPFHAYDPQRFGEFEEALELVFDWLTALRPEYGDHGWFNYGDVHMDTARSYETADPYAPLSQKYGFFFRTYRGWACSGYDWPTATWIQFARTGKRKYFTHSESNARHVMDLDICHDDADVAKRHRIWPRLRGSEYVYSGMHWTYGPLRPTLWTHADFLLYQYCLTGYRRAKDVLDEVAASALTKEWYVNPECTRENTNPPKVYCRLYEMTHDEEFLYRAHRYIQSNLKYHPQTPGMYIWPGLFYYYNLTGRPEARELYLSYLELYAPAAATWDKPPSFSYGAQEGPGYAYWMTGDPKYLRYAQDMMRCFSDGVQREGLPTQRGMQSNGLPVIFMGPTIRGLPALLAALAAEEGKVPHTEIAHTALLEQLPPDSLRPFPGFNCLNRVYLQEERDHAFRIENPFQWAYGSTAKGEVLMQVVAPSGKLVAEKRVRSELLKTDDQNLRLEVPPDGEAGQYELRLLLNGPTGTDTGSAFVRVRTDLGKVMYDATNRVEVLYGPGKLWFYVPSGTKQFTLTFEYWTGGGVVLRDPDDARVAGISPRLPKAGTFASVDPMVVEVKPGKDGRWWHLCYDVIAWPPLPVRFQGIPPYVAVREAERFVVK